MSRVLIILTIALLSAGCRAQPDQRPAVDVLRDPAAAQEVETNNGKCEVAHPDGVQCNKKACKKDETGPGDCADFAKRCLEYDHHYSGTKDGGTCSRVL
jgi:hypothetical protein